MHSSRGWSRSRLCPVPPSISAYVTNCINVTTFMLVSVDGLRLTPLLLTHAYSTDDFSADLSNNLTSIRLGLTFLVHSFVHLFIPRIHSYIHLFCFFSQFRYKIKMLTDRQTDRGTDGQTDRQTDREMS